MTRMHTKTSIFVLFLSQENQVPPETLETYLNKFPTIEITRFDHIGDKPIAHISIRGSSDHVSASPISAGCIGVDVVELIIVGTADLFGIGPVGGIGTRADLVGIRPIGNVSDGNVVSQQQ